jgi:hypothetical protein
MSVARSRQVCINWVVEALLVAINLTEKKDVYIHIRLTWSPEANLPPGACPAETPPPRHHLADVYRLLPMTETRPIRNSRHLATTSPPPG